VNSRPPDEPHPPSVRGSVDRSIGTLWSKGAVINQDAETGIGGLFWIHVYADSVNDQGQIVLWLEGAVSQEWLLTHATADGLLAISTVHSQNGL
jgi:hypothetical protein